MNPVAEKAAASLQKIVVCGAHMTGLPLNHQLLERGGRLVRVTRTSPCYRLYLLPGGPPRRPGLLRVAAAGQSILVEVWQLPMAAFGDFVAQIPSPLGIGKVILEDGETLPGFLCEWIATTDAEDISHFGSWRAWLAEGAVGK